MNQQKVSLIAGAIVLLAAAGASGVFSSDRPEDYDRLALVKPILEADLVLVGNAQYLTETKDEIIDKFSGVRILYNWSGQGKSQPATKRSDSSAAPSPATVPAEIVVITPGGGHTPGDPVIFGEQIVFLKIDRLTPDRLKEYRRGIVQELERIGEKLSPAEKKEVEHLLKGTELVCRPCSGWQSAIDLNPDVKSLSNKVFKERYKITKPASIIGAVQSLCAWRDLKTQQEKVDYLLKLLNDNPSSQLYLDNVPELLKSLGVNAEQKGGRYVAGPAAPPVAKDKDVAK